jgi:hypothetical protein
MLAGVPKLISDHFPYGLRSDKRPSSPPDPEVNDGGGGSSQDAMALPPEADVILVRCLGHSRRTWYTLA